MKCLPTDSLIQAPNNTDYSQGGKAAASECTILWGCQRGLTPTRKFLIFENYRQSTDSILVNSAKIRHIHLSPLLNSVHAL